jgi:hypothetical protein
MAKSRGMKIMRKRHRSKLNNRHNEIMAKAKLAKYGGVAA